MKYNINGNNIIATLIIVIFSAQLVIISPIGSSYPDQGDIELITNNKVGHWTFDQEDGLDVYDILGNGHDGIMKGTDNTDHPMKYPTSVVTSKLCYIIC